jgi:hypothetical protein
MQDSVPNQAAAPAARLANPLLDVVIACAEGQLKFWQAYQVEGAMFIAKRMRADLEFLRSLGHCGDVQSISECQWTWMGNWRKDYAEECGRLAGTTFALGVSDIAPMGWLLRTAKTSKHRASNITR